MVPHTVAEPLVQVFVLRKILIQMAMESRIRDLERKLAAVTTERDDLLKDVEALAISNGSSMFSSSYVLSERVSAVDKVTS